VKRIIPMLISLFVGSGCVKTMEDKLTAGDGVWQIAEYRIKYTDQNTGEVRIDETVTNAGQIQFVTEYNDWGGQWAIVELPQPSPSWPGDPGVVTELSPTTKYVLWDWKSDGFLQLAWGSDWSYPEEIELKADGNGFSGSSLQNYQSGVTGTEDKEQHYVLVP